MERNRSPVFVTCPARVGAVLVAVAVWILPALAGAQQEYQLSLSPPEPEPRPYQEGSVTQFWTLPEEAWNVDTWLWPSRLSPSVDFTQHFWFNGAGNAYTSLQQDLYGMRQASFSIWDATGAERSVIPGADCYAFDGGRTCTIPYDFSTDRWYRLRIWRLSITSYGTWWWGSVTDDAGNASHIGSILAPLGDDLITGTLSFSEYSGTSVGYPCGLLPPSTVYFYQPILNNGGSRATLSSSDTQQCSAGRVTPLWNGTLSQLDLNYMGVSDAEYEVTIDDASFDRSESFEYDGEIFWRYWVQVTATNTGRRALVPDFAGDFTGNPAFLFVTFYDSTGDSLGFSLKDVDMGVAPWNPGEQRRGSLWGTVFGHERSRVYSYVLYTYDQDEVACIGCEERACSVACW